MFHAKVSLRPDHGRGARVLVELKEVRNSVGKRFDGIFLS